MKIVTWRPAAPLSDFVDVFWYCENPAPGHTRERALPDGRMALIVNLLDDRLSAYDAAERQQSMRGIALAGAMRNHMSLDTAEQRRIMGVHFKPGGAFPFLGVPADALFDTHLSLDHLWGGDAHSVHQALVEAASPQSKFTILEAALMRRAGRTLGQHPLVAHVLQSIERAPRIGRMAALAHAGGVSPKRLIQLFRDEVGMTPKLYCRIRRFRHVLRTIETRRTVEWAAVAADCGYYDQAHFIRDFREFSGWNPAAFLVVRGERINHIPLPEPPHISRDACSA